MIQTVYLLNTSLQDYHNIIVVGRQLLEMNLHLKKGIHIQLCLKQAQNKRGYVRRNLRLNFLCASLGYSDVCESVVDCHRDEVFLSILKNRRDITLERDVSSSMTHH